MAADDVGVARKVTPVASVWCRQVDNEAESPGYTAIPDEFPGRRETLDTIRIVGNLTINVADTHDYWDPSPTQSLSFYPNLFLYPAAGGRYTCVGRMFLSTEDRPRLGMKTLVYTTNDLYETAEFGPTILRAYASMDGHAVARRPAVPPDPSIFQTVGEGFLFHRGSTEPVVVVASDQWESVAAAVLEVLGSMPSSLVAMGAFLVFPYFLPATKVDMHEFAEQLPLALAVMRVPRSEAAGDRHTKRIASWAEQPVTLRDLTKPVPTGKTRETLPLVLQYVRDDDDAKSLEVARRVDTVEFPRMGRTLGDAERQTGHEHRKEMWRIGTAMETAALLLSKPRGRSLPVSSETAKRANAYLEAKPGESPILAAAPGGAPPGPARSPATSVAPPPPSASAGTALPAWLRAPATPVPVPGESTAGVPVSKSDDPSLLRAPVAGGGPGAAAAPATGSPTAPAPPPATPVARPGVQPSPRASAPAPSPPPAGAAAVAVSAAPPSQVGSPAYRPIGALRPPSEVGAARSGPAPPSPADLAFLDERVGRAVREAEARWNQALDARTRDLTEASARFVTNARSDLEARIGAIEAAVAARPTPPTVSDEFAKQLDARVAEAVRTTSEGWAERFRRDLKETADQISAQSANAEEELRAALVAQLDLEVFEAKEQGTALREEIEGRVREILKQHLDAASQGAAKEIRDSEQRLQLLVEGRTKELETKLDTTHAAQTSRLATTQEERVAEAERRLAVERDARLAEISEAQTAAVAGLQVRMQSFFEQRIREDQARAEEKYVELLARLKADLEQNVERSLASPQFDASLRDRLARVVESKGVEQRKAFAEVVEAAEERIRQQGDESMGRIEAIDAKVEERSADLARMELTVRGELDDLERRLLVVNDHVLPVVRQTWLKVSAATAESQERSLDARFEALRKEVDQELRRLEGDSLERAAELRDRLEASVATHGRIWLSLLRQLSPGGGLPPPAYPPSHRGPRRPSHSGASSGSPPPARRASDPMDPYGPDFALDPPNPMDPQLTEPSDPPSQDPRRRPRRA